MVAWMTCSSWLYSLCLAYSCIWCPILHFTLNSLANLWWKLDRNSRQPISITLCFICRRKGPTPLLLSSIRALIMIRNFSNGLVARENTIKIWKVIMVCYIWGAFLKRINMSIREIHLKDTLKWGWASIMIPSMFK